MPLLYRSLLPVTRTSHQLPVPPPGGGSVPRLPSRAWYYRGAIVVLSCYYRGTGVVLACYRNDTGMIRQGRSLMSSSMRWAICHREGEARGDHILHRIVPAGKLYTTPTVLSSGEALKKRNFVCVLSNLRGPAGGTLAAIYYLRFFIFHFSIRQLTDLSGL